MRSQYPIDDLLEMRDTGLLAASAAWQVDSANKIIDVGLGLIEAVCIIDISAIEVDTTDEVYTMRIEGSNSATFASGIQDVASLQIGATAVIAPGDVTTGIGRLIMPFRNEFMGTVYRYIRGYTTIAGTIGTGINFTAWMSVNRGI